MPKANQYKPLPPEEELHHWIKHYWQQGLSEQKIVDHILDHFDRSKYGLSTKSLRRAREKMGLKGTRQQNADFNTIGPFIQDIRTRFPNMGARQLVKMLREDYSIKVPEKTIAMYLREVEPEAVSARKCRPFSEPDGSLKPEGSGENANP